MDVLVLHPERFQQLYDCSRVYVDSVPYHERQHLVSAIILLVAFVIMELIYVPCMFVIQKHLNQTSYKFMYYIGVNDIACMVINGAITGYLAIDGDVYCSKPQFIYLTGVCGNVFWYAGTLTSALLAFSRCVESNSEYWGKVLFAGNRTWVWLFCATIYGLGLGLFTKPFLFSSYYFTWFFNPYVGYIEDTSLTYVNLFYIVHNSAIAIALFLIYTVFIGLLLVKNLRYRTALWPSAQQQLAFLQCLLISFCFGFTCAIFVWMQYATLSPLVLIFGQFFWMGSHGLPGLIYVGLNPTFRGEIIKMFFGPAHRNAVTDQKSFAFDQKRASTDTKRLSTTSIMDSKRLSTADGKRGISPVDIAA